MKVNFAPRIVFKPQLPQIRKMNSCDTVSFGHTQNVVRVSDYINSHKVGETKIYDKLSAEYVLADFTDDGQEFRMYKNDVLLGKVEYAVEKADVVVDPLPADFIDSIVLFNPNPYSEKVLRGHFLEAFETGRYKGIGTNLVKALVQKSLESGTEGNVVVYAMNDFPDIKAKKDVSPIPFYHFALGFEPLSFEAKRALDFYKKRLERNPEKNFGYIGRQEDWMYLPKEKIEQHKAEFENNPVYKPKR